MHEFYNSTSYGWLARTLRGGKCEGCVGAAKSQMQISPSSAPDASKFGAMALNSRPRTWNVGKGTEVNIPCNLQMLDNKYHICQNDQAFITEKGNSQALCALKDVRQELAHLPQSWGNEARTNYYYFNHI